MIWQLLLLLLARVASASWGYTETSDSYIIDTGKGLVVTVSSENGDITSMLYNGVEYNGYDGKNTQVESGLGASDVSITEYSDPYIIKVRMSIRIWSSTPQWRNDAHFVLIGHCRVWNTEALPLLPLWEQ